MLRDVASRLSVKARALFVMNEGARHSEGQKRAPSCSTRPETAADQQCLDWLDEDVTSLTNIRQSIDRQNP